jgi:hypothetical protein
VFEARLARRLHETHGFSSGKTPPGLAKSLQELSPKPDLTRDDPAKPDIVPVLMLLGNELAIDRSDFLG